MIETHHEGSMLAARIDALGELEAMEAKAFETHGSYENFLREILHAEEDAEKADTVEPAQAMVIGTGLCLAGRAARSNHWLDMAGAGPIVHLLRGRNLRALRQFDEATESFQNARKAGVDPAVCDLELAETHLEAHRLDAAREAFKETGDSQEHSAERFYLQGLLKTIEGDYIGAIEVLEQAVHAQENHHKALFKLAYLYDLYGDEEAALTLYQACTARPPVHINALINLAVIYKDRSEWDQAERCLRRVLETLPNHPRAALFLRDVTSSRTMVYDEDHERSVESRNALLDLPISEFELSVRSRNCLKRMQINTLGDLLRTSESELLAYKNFGETSLAEIKNMLSQKGLRLGQLAQESEVGRNVLLANRATYVPQGNSALLNKPVSEVELSVRSRKCLQRLGISTLGELASRTEAELLGSKNFGVTSLAEVKQRLAEHGMSLRKLDE